ncbi:MAG TPA: ATP-binding protein [Gaiellaceae bacterium]|nr:ATP-binding protein [Gaiellaceae bacterium]
MSPSTVKLTMPAKAEYLILARLALTGISREVPMTEAVLADLKLAVTEACGNAVRHAYAADRGVVRVVFEVEPEEIEIRVEDEGSGVPGPRPDTELSEEEADLAESGMGLAIIRAIMDEFEVEGRGDGAGTLVRMRKRL